MRINGTQDHKYWPDPDNELTGIRPEFFLNQVPANWKLELCAKGKAVLEKGYFLKIEYLSQPLPPDI